MKWRIIVRMSFTGKDKGLRHGIERSLERCGLRKLDNWGAWEGKAVSAEDAANEFQKVFKLLEGIRGRQLNHLWVYIDHAIEKRVSVPVLHKKA